MKSKAELGTEVLQKASVVEVGFQEYYILENYEDTVLSTFATGKKMAVLKQEVNGKWEFVRNTPVGFPKNISAKDFCEMEVLIAKDYPSIVMYKNYISMRSYLSDSEDEKLFWEGELRADSGLILNSLKSFGAVGFSIDTLRVFRIENAEEVKVVEGDTTYRIGVLKDDNDPDTMRIDFHGKNSITKLDIEDALKEFDFDVDLRCIDLCYTGWQAGFKTGVQKGDYFVFTPCGENDLSFTIERYVQGKWQQNYMC